MTYRDNDVCIKLSDFYGFSLVRGSYTIESYYVTPGQDPDGNIHAGLVSSFGSDGKMTFKIGRKGSEDTARWFNDRIAPSQTTFGHSAGELNFAFIGTLKLVLTGDVYGKNEIAFTFLNVAIAQGHAGASNNWWFGGLNCSNTAGNIVACSGKNSNGADAIFNCKRGGNSVNEIALVPANMTYRDNEVTIRLSSSDYSLVRGSYTVESHSVTNGQDPNGNIYDGMTRSFDNEGKMVFYVGRKGSEDTAKWFNDRIAPSQTTFDHSAGELNFAFIGTLKLTLTGGIFVSGQETFTFSDVTIAQGHAGASNNWWFGGTHCSYMKDHKVSCTGISSRGVQATFQFLRGGNGVSTIEAIPITMIDTADWMSKLNDGTNLDQIIMPGSHDAGMSELHHCAPPVGIDGYTQTQSASIGGQLLDGARYFDIRVDFDYDELVTYHRENHFWVGWGCNGQTLVSVLDQTRDFLSRYNRETVILKFSHIRNESGHDPDDTKRLIDALLNNYSAYIYKNTSANINLAKVNLGLLRGKMILVFDYSEYIDPATGRFRYRDGSSAIPGSNLTVYDKYSETDDYNTMKDDQLQKWRNYGGLGKGYLFLLSWTLTPGLSSPTIAKMAKEANSRLPEILHNGIGSNKQSGPNIVYIDYVNNTISQCIIYYNF